MADCRHCYFRNAASFGGDFLRIRVRLVFFAQLQLSTSRTAGLLEDLRNIHRCGHWTLDLFSEQFFACTTNSTGSPAAVFMVVPFASSMSNGLGAYDGFSAIVWQLITWGIPYSIGRCVFRTKRHVADLVDSIILCGLLYVPLCLWEVKMSPQLHTQVYGFHQHSFAQSMRGGGWRPVVFMQHGLQVALWMCGCLVLCFSEWFVGQRKFFGKFSMIGIIVLMLGTFVLLKSVGAVALAILGMVRWSWFANFERPGLC